MVYIGVGCGIHIRWFFVGEQGNKKIYQNEENKKIQRELHCILFIYVSDGGLLPRNTPEVAQTEKYLTVAGSCVIVPLSLWLVLRKRVQMRERCKKTKEQYSKSKLAKKLVLAYYLLVLATNSCGQAQFEKGKPHLNPRYRVGCQFFLQ